MPKKQEPKIYTIEYIMNLPPKPAKPSTGGLLTLAECAGKMKKAHLPKRKRAVIAGGCFICGAKDTSEIRKINFNGEVRMFCNPCGLMWHKCPKRQFYNGDQFRFYLINRYSSRTDFIDRPLLQRLREREDIFDLQ